MDKDILIIKGREERADFCNNLRRDGSLAFKDKKEQVKQHAFYALYVSVNPMELG